MCFVSAVFSIGNIFYFTHSNFIPIMGWSNVTLFSKPSSKATSSNQPSQILPLAPPHLPHHIHKLFFSPSGDFICISYVTFNTRRFLHYNTKVHIFLALLAWKIFEKGIQGDSSFYYPPSIHTPNHIHTLSHLRGISFLGKLTLGLMRQSNNKRMFGDERDLYQALFSWWQFEH